MPVPALPIPHGAQPDRRVHRHSYIDPLNQPMTGTVTITSLRRLDQGDTVLPESATAVAELVDGVLEIELQPGFYKLVATLTSASGHSLTDVASITITG
jgi:hypothetical protein